MDEKNLKVIRYLAGMVFVVQFIQLIYGCVDRWDGYYWIQKTFHAAEIIGMLLMAVSMFTGTYSLLTIGAAMAAIKCLFDIFDGASFLMIITFISYVLVALTVSQRTNAIKIGIISSVLMIMANFLIYFAVYKLSFWDAIWYSVVSSVILEAVSAMLACFVVQNTPQTQTVKIKQPAIAQKTDNRIEELTKLKDLLDTGVISQEEFDAKKQQLLQI